MTHLFEMSVTDRDDAVYTKDDLLVGADGVRPTTRSPQGKLIDLEELDDRRRMDAGHRPLGPRSAYEGVVSWTPSARSWEFGPRSRASRLPPRSPTGMSPKRTGPSSG